MLKLVVTPINNTVVALSNDPTPGVIAIDPLCI